mmetsp:Transcript_48530/g.103982  ORF Transcript_48530/g.103982 Transcript_48530/m.103982 type:complete len:441 (-) Transcript_48530:90-1412(-)
MPIRDAARSDEVYEASETGERKPIAPEEEDGEPKVRSGALGLDVRWCGPGLMACLADTDAGCIIVAAQSGARWNYSLLLLQVVLIAPLFMAQELTIRLGIYTKKGCTACIRDHMGHGWAWLGVILLVLECFGAMLTEMAGIAVTAELWGLSRALGTTIAVIIILAVVFLCPYRHIEALGCVLGLFELVFVLTMFMYHPSPGIVFKGAFTFHSDPAYVGLITANIGAVIMPWMIYFQQSAIVAKRLQPGQNMLEERRGTLLGTILTQLVMIGTLVTLAAAKGMDRNLDDVQDIVFALSQRLGTMLAKVLVSLGFVGGSLCAAFVVSIAPAWAICEAAGDDGSFALDRAPTQEPFFYISFGAVVIAGAAVLLSGVDIVKFDIFVEVMDGLLAPLTMFYLFILATSAALPDCIRVVGAYKYFLAVVFSCVSVLSFGSMVYSLI